MATLSKGFFLQTRSTSQLEWMRNIKQGEVIEDYPEDPRGHSCLMLGKGGIGRAIHVVCSPKDDYLAIITAYLPDRKEWSPDFKVRLKK